MKGADMKEIAANIISGVVRKEISAMNTIDDQLQDTILSDDSNDITIMKLDNYTEKEPDEMDNIELKEYLGEESLYLLMEEVLKTLQEEDTPNEFIEQLYESNAENEFTNCNLDDIDNDNDSSIVCPFCKFCNMKIFENDGYGYCIGCGSNVSLYSSVHNCNISLIELRSCLADFFDHHGNGNCCNFDCAMDTSHLQFTCLNHTIHVQCLACQFSGNLYN